MGCNLLSLEGSGNSSFSKASLQLNSSVFSLLIIECLGQLVVSGYLLPLLTFTPKCVSIFRGSEPLTEKMICLLGGSRREA